MKKNNLENRSKIQIGVIGLGYVGLPLAVSFSNKYKVLGFDINKARVEEIESGYDRTKEIDNDEICKAFDLGLSITANINDLKKCNFYIITVPTPIDRHNNPLLDPLISASEMIGKILDRNNIVVYESTVYPGVTEEICVPILEKFSGLKLNKEFFVGYSPERINPGDKEHKLNNILKITSGSNKESSELIDQVYKDIIQAGTYLAPSIKVAEAAKVIENSQRDINIAFINELAKILNLLNIDTREVLEAAGTKWNFLPFQPGLVGGHCIGVDPYYLAQKAQEHGYHPEIILAGRRINDSMGIYVANQLIKLMIANSIQIAKSNILMLGITFKENCPDIRNSKAVDVYEELKSFGCNIDVFDPQADYLEVEKAFNIKLIADLKGIYDAIILVVSHNEFLNLNLNTLKKETCVIYDVKGFYKKDISTSRL